MFELGKRGNWRSRIILEILYFPGEDVDHV
jgi:hypothetical protein